MSDDFLDDMFADFDEFDGDDEFREIIVGNRDSCETQRVVSDLDAEWFRDNPKFRHRIRWYVPGEFDSDSGGFVGDPSEFVVLATQGGTRVLFPVGTFSGRGLQAGGLR
ncbi:hypothetical protein [Nocardioides albidus]|uniref:hypothetical protein n=1 Tax=Nocardioides albidus TaxID=1517589 RepID=UPI0013053731|nr:hypothetical protein [Nocardioides albidus]